MRKRAPQNPVKKTPKKAVAKKAPGRPKKAPGEKLEQFSVRLPPKLKFGLDLLRRVQGGRSLSQVLEWALQVGLRNAIVTDSYRVPRDRERSEPETVGELTDALWSIENDKERLVTLWRRAPTLVDFEDRGICELVYNSKELTPNMVDIWRNYRPEVEAMLDSGGWWDFSADYHRLVWVYLDRNWETFKSIAHEMQLAGKSLRDLSIEEIARRHSRDLEEELFETVKPAYEKWLPSIA